MKLGPFKLERYFAKHEHRAEYLFSASDCDGITQKELLGMADNETERLWRELKLSYTEASGSFILRQEVAKLYKDTDPSEALILTPEEGIFIALNTILEKGDHVICTFPGYQSLYEIPMKIGCMVSKWKLKEENEWKPDLTILKKLIQPNTKMIIINFPHNPTGYLPSLGDFNEIIKIARENDIYIFSDEMYYSLEHDKKDKIPSVSETYGKGISLSGMSKAYGMAGVRIAWLVLKEGKLFAKMAALKDFTSFCSSAPSEILSIIALKNKEIILSRNLDLIRKNIETLESFFKNYENLFSWTKPKAGTVGFPRINFDAGSKRFCQTLLKDTGIMAVPSSLYDFDDKHLRVGFGRKNIQEVLSVLEEYLQANKSHFQF